MSRWAWAEVSAEAIQHNVRTLVDAVTPSELWAVVKANGYGHGSVLAARAALDGGASGLCVALVQEGMQLRRAGITAPILVLNLPHMLATDWWMGLPWLEALLASCDSLIVYRRRYRSDLRDDSVVELVVRDTTNLAGSYLTGIVHIAPAFGEDDMRAACPGLRGEADDIRLVAAVIKDHEHVAPPKRCNLVHQVGRGAIEQARALAQAGCVVGQERLVDQLGDGLAAGQELGGAVAHSSRSGVAHFAFED